MSKRHLSDVKFILSDMAPSLAKMTEDFQRLQIKINKSFNHIQSEEIMYVSV